MAYMNALYFSNTGRKEKISQRGDSQKESCGSCKKYLIPAVIGGFQREGKYLTKHINTLDDHTVTQVVISYDMTISVRFCLPYDP